MQIYSYLNFFKKRTKLVFDRMFMPLLRPRQPSFEL